MKNERPTALRQPVTKNGVSPVLLDRYSRLAGVSPVHRARIAAACSYELVPADYVVYRQGEVADDVYLLLSGAVSLVRRDSTQAIVDKHDTSVYMTFGDSVLTGEVDRPHTATADCTSILVRVPLVPLREMLEWYPDVALDWSFEVMSRARRRAQKQRPTDFLRGILDAINAA